MCHYSAKPVAKTSSSVSGSGATPALQPRLLGLKTIMTSPQGIRTDVREAPAVSVTTARNQWTIINAAGPPPSLGHPPMQGAAHARLLLPSPNHLSSRPSSTGSESEKRRGKIGLKPLHVFHTDGSSHSREPTRDRGTQAPEASSCSLPCFTCCNT